MREITIRVPEFTLTKSDLYSPSCWEEQSSSGTTKAAPSEPEHVHEESESGPGETVALTPEALRNAEIKTLEVQPRPLQEWIEATGVVEPDLNHVARVRALARGSCACVGPAWRSGSSRPSLV